MDFSYLVFLALKSAISLSVSLTIPPNVVRNKDLEFCSCFQVFGNSTKLNEDMSMCSKKYIEDRQLHSCPLSATLATGIQ